MIEIRDLSFSYRRRSPAAVKDVSMQVGPGIMLLLGENGAGKTTLMKLIAGLLLPGTGSVTLDGTDTSLRLPSTQSRILYIGDETRLPAPTVNATAAIHGCFYPGFSPAMLAANLQAFGLCGEEPLNGLSTGQARKAIIAYALALQLPVLLLDEPANGLDIQSKQTLARLLATNLRPDQTVIVSTHTVADLETLFDGLTVMHGNRLMLTLPLATVEERLQFVTSLSPVPGALYQQALAGAFHAMLPAEAETDARPGKTDLNLLYTALMSREADTITDILS